MSGLAPAGCYRPSFHSWPSAACLREPLMSNVRRHKSTDRPLSAERQMRKQVPRSGKRLTEVGPVVSGGAGTHEAECKASFLPAFTRGAVAPEIPAPQGPDGPPVPQAGGRLTTSAAWTSESPAIHCSSAFLSGTLCRNQGSNAKHQVHEFLLAQAKLKARQAGDA